MILLYNFVPQKKTPFRSDAAPHFVRWNMFGRWSKICNGISKIGLPVAVAVLYMLAGGLAEWSKAAV
jgi:hypothetical protein